MFIFQGLHRFVGLSYHLANQRLVLFGLSKCQIPWDFRVPSSLCPGTQIFSCPGVPLSWDKGRSKCPGTKPSVLGHRPGYFFLETVLFQTTILRWDYFSKRTKKQEKDVPKQEKDVPKQEKDVPKQEKDVPKQEKDVLKQEKDVPKQEKVFWNRKS